VTQQGPEPWRGWSAEEPERGVSYTGEPVWKASTSFELRRALNATLHVVALHNWDLLP
jgi:hypothetical protein